jgi:riboflavin biosynthesis pyrimidine reductase
VEVVDSRDGRVDLDQALGRLHGMGIEAVLVEGGSEVITALLRDGLVDRLIASIAPVVIGTGTSAVGQLDITRIADGISLDNRSIVVVDDDVLLAGDVRR